MSEPKATLGQETAIELTGVSTHNLKTIDAHFPLGKITVVTGRSGSGKSSLVFDTLYAESYRRYVESLSSFARQYLQALPKPEVKVVNNLPPAIAVKQSRSQANARSTVGTMTELADLLRVIFAIQSHVWCDTCGVMVRKDSPRSAVAQLMEQQAKLSADGAEAKGLILAPLDKWRGMKAEDLAYFLSTQGFTRLQLGGKILRLEEVSLPKLADASVVIDRLTLNQEHAHRLQDAFYLAFQIGKGKASFSHPDLPMAVFTNDMSCAYCAKVYKAPSLSLFNHNHPIGACETCQGFGRTSILDWAKIIPNKNSSLAENGVIPFNSGKFSDFYDWAKASAQKRKIKFAKPFSEYTPEEWTWLVKGAPKEGYPGIEGLFTYLDSKKYKAHYRIMAARFRAYDTCAACHGKRLNRFALACQIEGKTFADVNAFTIAELEQWIEDCEALRENPDADRSVQQEARQGYDEAIEEAKLRLTYLMQVGLSYLPLSRLTQTLSGGEAQRINMARSLGSALTGTLFCLDEPTCGLHPRDTGRLIKVMRDMQAQGNTLVVVEHDSQVIGAADHLVKIGPEAGHEGGFIDFSGRPEKAPQEAPIQWPKPVTLKPKIPMITLANASVHNLRDVTVSLPVGHLTVVCGVSGSGKTSLIQHALYPLLNNFLKVDATADVEVGKATVGPLDAIKKHQQVVLVGQENLNRSSRSNIATYLDFYDGIRKKFAAQDLAKKRKYTPGTFSFNVAGGRCENCKGLGTVDEDLSFLGEMEVVCQVCQGKRFIPDVLEVLYRGKNLYEVLNLTVAEARAFFYDDAELSRIFNTVIHVGLGYVRLGQHTSSFSGGEAQRLKLLWLLKDAKTSKPSILIFDEPMTGLSDYDVCQLLGQLRELCALGHTIVVIEHHLQTIAAADWIIEIGPEAGLFGGRAVYQGVVAHLPGVSESPTAPFLTPLM